MSKIKMIFVASAAAMVLILPAPAAVKETALKERKDNRAEITVSGPAQLWRDPVDIRSRNLFYGPGGKKHQPPLTFVFEKEDMKGSNPKLVVRDAGGVKWKIKLGQEARPETVASRFVWAVGYAANEDYFLRSLRVEGLPPHLHRGQKLVGPDGSIQNARLKRYVKDEKKVGIWSWRNDPFTGTRELNGLRVLMALMNNWDLKDENNAVYAEKQDQTYLVSDLGASFGATHLSWTQKSSKGNLGVYSRSPFIAHVGTEYVDFNVPARPALIRMVSLPEFIRRVHMRSLGKHIPRDDARWMGGLLARLSPHQINDAFRAAGYSPQEVAGFSRVVEERIAELNRL